MEKERTSESIHKGEYGCKPQKQRVTKVSVGQKGSIKHKTSRSIGSVVTTNQAHTIKGHATMHFKSTSASIWYGINTEN